MIGIVDYVVFGVALVIPIIIALYFTCIKKQKSNFEFLMANRSVSAIPMSFSLCANYLSAVTITGIPGEIAYHGWLFPVTWLIATTAAALIFGNLFIPIFYKMRLTSVYEYLELRYESRAVRLLGTLNYSVGIILYLGVVLYAPCLALQTVTGLSIYGLICIIGITCTIYTVMGGLKTVIWTDLFQCLIIVASLIAIIVKGSEIGGGIERIWEVGVGTGRIQWANWDPSPFVRNTSLGIFFGQFILWGAIFSTHQTQVQRYCATKSLSHARGSLALSVFLMWIVTICAILTGLVVYAVYWSCDPKSGGRIGNKDEIVTHFVEEHLSAQQGLVGLFVAGLLSGALSTLSSGLNSLAAVIWEDVFVAFGIASSRGYDIGFDDATDKRQLIITRAIATLMGVITIGFAALAPSLEGILQLANASMAVLAGPLLATFLLGFFTSFSNKIGAIFGFLLGDAACLWLMIGSYIWRPTGATSGLPTYDVGCQMTRNETGNLDISLVVQKHEEIEVKSTFFYVPDGNWETIFYSTSYNLYAPFGFLICIFVNIIVSLVARAVQRCRGEKGPFVEPVLLHPLVRDGTCFSCCCRSRNRVKISAAMRNGTCPRHPFNTIHFNGGGGGHTGYSNRQQSDPSWNEDSHYRWPSPSLPPTLKKGTTMTRNNNNYDNYEMQQNRYYNTGSGGKGSKVKGTLDHGRIHERAAIPTSRDDFSSGNNGAINSHNNGREYYNLTPNEKFSRRSRVLKKQNFDFNQSEEILDEFGDVVVVRSKPRSSQQSPKRTPNKNLYSYSNKTKTSKFRKDMSSDEDDGWTTEF